MTTDKLLVDEDAFDKALHGIPRNSYDGNMYYLFVLDYEAAKQQQHKHSLECSSCYKYGNRESMVSVANAWWHKECLNPTKTSKVES